MQMYTLRQTQEFQDWLDRLKDRRAQIRIVARLRLAEAGISATGSPLAVLYRKCESMWGQGIGCTSHAEHTS